jgi:hypothetical protein
MLSRLWYLILFIFGLVRNHTKKPEHDMASLPEKKAVKVAPTAEEEEAEAAADTEKKLTEGLSEEVAKEIDKEIVKEVKLPTPFKPNGKPKEEPTLWERRWAIIQEIIDRPYDSPIEELPSRRYSRTKKLADGGENKQLGVYEVYGRPSKQPKNNRIKGYKVCQQRTHKKLPGKWNKGSGRLYMQVDAGQHLREALERASELEERISELLGEDYPVLNYMYSLGSYSYRHIQHNPAKDLSYHSWTIAADQNPGWNRGVKYHATKWLRRVKKTVNGKKRTVWVETSPSRADEGPINKVLPFSKQYWEVFPESMPCELVFAFKSVHWAWGGDWGRWKWQAVLEKFGDKYDQNDPAVKNSKEFKDAMEEWASMRYYDGMHVELTTRGEFARTLWARHEARLRDNVDIA